MTQSKNKMATRQQSIRIILCLVCTALALMFMKNSALAASLVRGGLELCAKTVIPAVFPSTVLASLFISLGGGYCVGKLLSKPMHALFGISGAGGSVLLVGWLCGFPVGALTGASLVRRGELGEKEFSRLMLFSNVPSPAFAVCAVGDGLFGDGRIGFLFYLFALIASFLTGIIQKMIMKPSVQELCFGAPAKTDLGAILASAASSMLTLSACVVFFSAFSGLLLSSLDGFLSPEVSAFICGLFEISGGSAAAAALEGREALAITAFIFGWSGLGVHFQIISACEGHINTPVYFLVKFLQGSFCAALCVLVLLTV